LNDRQGRRVLLAEDNLINQTVAKKMLGQMGMQCTVASNGAEAVDALRAAAATTGQQFEVVLMDMAMPVMGGVDATKVRVTTQGVAPGTQCQARPGSARPRFVFRFAKGLRLSAWTWACLSWGGVASTKVGGMVVVVQKG